MRPGGRLRGAQVARRGHDHAALALDRLQQDRRGRVVDRRGEGLGVAVRHDGDVAGQRPERLGLGRLRGQRQRAHRAAVEAARGDDDAGAAGAAGHLERRLVGLGAGVGEEDPPGPPGERRAAARPAGSGARRRTSWRRAPGGDLGRDRLDDGRVGVAEGVDGDAGEQVEVAVAVGVPDVAPSPRTKASDGVPYVGHHRGAPTVEHRRGAASLGEGAHDAAPGTTCVPMPSSVKTSSSSACGTRPSSTCAFGDSAAHRSQAGLHLGDHARATGSAAAPPARRRVICAIDLVAARPVAVEALDVGEHDELLGAQRDGQRRRRGVGVDVVDLLPSAPRATLETTGMQPVVEQAVARSPARPSTTSPTRPMSTCSPSTIAVAALGGEQVGVLPRHARRPAAVLR